MYITRIQLDANSRKTVEALSNPQKIHGKIENSFTGEKKRKLWRIDNTSYGLFILLVSEDEPEKDEISKTFGSIALKIETKNYDKFLESIKENDIFYFRLSANPVYSVYMGENKRGKIRAYAAVEKQKEWLLKRQEDLGIKLEEEKFDVVESIWMKFRKKSGNLVKVKRASFEGILEVKDVEKLRKAMTEGIGREKAYGCGLLTLAR